MAYTPLDPNAGRSPMGMAPGGAGARQRPPQQRRRPAGAAPGMQHGRGGGRGGGGAYNIPPATATVPNETNQLAGPSPGSPAAAAGNPATAGNKGGQPPQGGPFQMQNWYGGNPLQTAADRAGREFSKQMGQINARMGGMGLGNSSRRSIMEGTALGEFGTGLGDVLAQRGLGAYQSDADRALMANQQLANMGTGLTGIGSTEQQLPGIGAFMNLLSGLTGQNLFSSFHQGGGGGYWT